MKTTRLARRPGVDGNPLRRRTDKIAAWVLLQNTPAPAADGVTGYSWVRARWIAPDGRTRPGRTRHHRSAQAYQAADHGNRLAGGFGSGGR